MNKLTIFPYEGNEVRTLTQYGELWFAGKDVCAVFGDTNHNRSLSRVVDEDKTTIAVDTSAGTRNVIFINETGLYDLLFSMQPQRANNGGVQNAYPKEIKERIEKLSAFRRWVTHEVLPSIRKTGLYATAEAAEKLLSDPDFLISALTELKAIREKNAALAIANEDLTVKLNESEKFWTIMKFNQHFNMGWNMKTCQHNGRAASTYSRQHGYEIGKCQTGDDRFKETNSYAYEVLEFLFLNGKRGVER